MTPPDPTPPAPPASTRDPDLLKVGDALRRAGLKARTLALQTGTPCYVWREGRVVNIGTPVPAAGTARADGR